MPFIAWSIFVHGVREESVEAEADKIGFADL